MRQLPPPVFRPAAAQTTSPADDLEPALTATNPRGWISLAAVLLLLLAGVAWSLSGRVANKVEGRGILVHGGGVLEIVAPAGGRVSDVSVGVGDSVVAGQVVARLVQPDLLDKLEAARARLASARVRHEQVQIFSTRQQALEQRALDQQLTDADASIRAAEEKLQLLRQRLTSQQKLYEQGLVTQMTLLTTRQQVDEATDEIRRHRAAVADIALKRLEASNRRADEVRISRVALSEAEGEVGRLEREVTASTEVVSAFTGRILELMTEQGKIVDRGEPMLSLDLTGNSAEQLVAVAYVPSVYGKMVRPGMRIHIAPATVRQEEFGMLVGAVTFVSDYPATVKGMRRVLKNDRLVDDLAGEGAPYEVHASLLPDPRTASGYRWTSSSGPPLRIESGTLANALITIREQRPAELAMPILRSWIGS